MIGTEESRNLNSDYIEEFSSDLNMFYALYKSVCNIAAN